MVDAAPEGKRSWRSPPRGSLVRRSRHVWRWILSILAISLIAFAVYWAWPRPDARTLLLVLGFFVCLPVAVFMWIIGADLFKTAVERVGRDVVVTIPLHVATDSQDAVRRWPQSRLKKLLSCVPIYERLLDTYPDARIHPR